ncbi:MAG: DegT/DnrJ/EryC1/StrS family aminotransferase [Caldilineaceae bacterium]
MQTQFSSSPIYLSPPHLSGLEQKYVQTAFDTNWVAPLGPNVDAFEQEFCKVVGCRHAVALSSGTAALHLALQLAGIRLGDEVLVSTLTFCASVNPILYLGGYPTFIDSERTSWNMDPNLLIDTLVARARAGRLPKAVVLVHLYGQSANLQPILESCRYFNIPLIEDAAEALGATYQGKAPGAFGHMGIFSFNGNKIITTSGGGMLVSDDAQIMQYARKLATQAREPTPHYEHVEVGYNYRLSNVLAGVGRGQLQVLEDRVQARRRNAAYYMHALAHLPGIQFMPEASWGRHSRWLTVITIDPKRFGADRERVRLALQANNIEARPVWKPMHQQPIYRGYECVGGSVADDLFQHGLCLPSGSNMSNADLARVTKVICDLHVQSMRSAAYPVHEKVFV